MRADALGREMVELSAHIGAGEARFLELLAEFDRDKLWRSVGCANAAQWLTWQCGFGEVAARERVRVARALEHLPKIRASFRRGELSYSKVRELTRVAEPQNEASLLHVALHSTAAHVQRWVAKYRRVQQVDVASETVAQYLRRCVHYRHEEDGTVVIEAKLPIEIGEVVIRAIDAAVEVLYREAVKKSSTETTPGIESADQPASITPQSDLRRVETESNVPAETRNSLESQSDVPAETLNGLETQSNVPAETHSDERASDIAPLDRVAAQEGETPPLRTRRADALLLLADSFLSAPAGGRVDTCADRYQVVVHIDQALLAGAGNVQRHAHSQGLHAHGDPLFACCELESGHALARDTARRLACDATLVGVVKEANGEPLNVGRRTRAIPPALRRALRARDGGCRFPSCGRTRFTQGHHIIHWADGGETSLKNLITLCTFHHVLVHEGGFSIQRLSDGTFAFFAPDGERLPNCGRAATRTLEMLRRAAEHDRVTLREIVRIDRTTH